MGITLWILYIPLLEKKEESTLQNNHPRKILHNENMWRGGEKRLLKETRRMTAFDKSITKENEAIQEQVYFTEAEKRF